MTLKDSLAQFVNQPVERACCVKRIHHTLSEDDADALTAAIDLVRRARESGAGGRNRTGVSASAIYRALRDDGHKVSEDSVSRHIYLRCACVD